MKKAKDFALDIITKVYCEHTKPVKHFVPTCIFFSFSLAYLSWKNLPFDLIGVIIALLGLGFVTILLKIIPKNRLVQYGMVLVCCIVWLFGLFYHSQRHVFVYEIARESAAGSLIDWTNDFTRLIKKGIKGSDFEAVAKKDKLRWHKSPGLIRGFLRRQETYNQAALIIGGSLEYLPKMITVSLISSCYYSADQKSAYNAKLGHIPKYLQEKAYHLLKKLIPTLKKDEFLKDTNEITGKICGCYEAVESHLDYYRNRTKIGSFGEALDSYRKCLKKDPNAYTYRYDLGLLYIHHYEDTKKESSLRSAENEFRKIIYGATKENISACSEYYPAWMQLGNIYWYLAEGSKKAAEQIGPAYEKAINYFKKATDYLEEGRDLEPRLEKRTCC